MNSAPLSLQTPWYRARKLALIIYGLEVSVILAALLFNLFLAVQLRDSSLAVQGATLGFVLYFLAIAVLGFFWFGLLRKWTRLATWSWLPIVLVASMIYFSGIFYSGFPDVIYWLLLLLAPIFQMVVFLNISRITNLHQEKVTSDNSA